MKLKLSSNKIKYLLNFIGYFGVFIVIFIMYYFNQNI